MSFPYPLHAFPADADGPRPAVLVLPGGGYAMLAEHGGAGYASWLRDCGLHAFVLEYPVAPHRHLEYPVAPHRHPLPLAAATAALAPIRSGDHGLHVDADRVGVIGSSAGGDLAGCPSVGAANRDAPRPAFTVLCYPVISFLDEPDVGSAENLLGPDPSEEARAALSLERLVDDRTPPTFLWSTADDEAVPVSNSLRYAQALVDAGVSTELHVLPRGRHGLGLAPDDPDVAGWSRLCEDWLRRGGWAESREGTPA